MAVSTQEKKKRSGGPARAKGISRAEWEQLLAEYRLQPGHHAAVARATGLSERTCALYWERGSRLPQRPWAAVPIKQIVEKETLALRAELQLSREAAERSTAVELGRLDALRARADLVSERISNVELARIMKAQVLGVARMLQGVLDGVGESATKGLRAIFEGEQFAELAKRDPEAALKHVRTLVKLTAELGAAAEGTVKLERLLLGESTENKTLEVQHRFESTDDALAVIQRATAAAARVRGDVIDVQATATRKLGPAEPSSGASH